MSKAFDTIDHNILLDKLQLYGLRGNVLEWMRSYLSNRTQYVSVNNIKSDASTINRGVPQGSILGPLMFIIYINDIVNISQVLNMILFADDTNLFFSALVNPYYDYGNIIWGGGNTTAAESLMLTQKSYSYHC